MLLLAFLYAVAVIPVFSLISYEDFMSIILMYVVLIACCVVTGIWTVLGTGQYLLRTLIASLLASFILIGFFVSTFVAEHSLRDTIFYFSVFEIKTILWSFVLLTIASQIPFWVVRGFTGWHFCQKSEMTSRTISIREMLWVVTLFAIGIMASQRAQNAILEEELSNLVVGSETYLLAEDETEIPYQVLEITRENIEQLKTDAKRRNRENTVLWVAIYPIVAGFISLPIVWWSFRKNGYLSLLLTFIYGIAVCISFVIGGAYLDSSQNLALRDLVWIVVAGLLTVVCIWMPLKVLQKSGLVLQTAWTKKDATASIN